MIRSFALANQWSIPKRHLRVTLYDGRELKNLKQRKVLTWVDEKVNVSFSTSTSAYGMAAEANVMITGLKLDTMSYLATSYRYWEKNPIYNEIKIEAGYDNNYGLIYEGTIIEAIPNLNSANFSINLKCFSLYSFTTTEKMTLSYEKITVGEIIAEIAKAIGALPKVTQEASQMEIRDYRLSNCSPIEHMRYVAQITGLNVYLDKNGLFVKKADEPMVGYIPLKVDSSNIIGSPMPTAEGCNVSIRMNPDVVAGQLVELDSLRFPKINAKDYVIGTYYHTGETKGAKWETHLNLIRRNIYGTR